MKKLLLSLLMMAGFLTTFAQQDETERKLGVKEIPIELILKAVPPGQQKLDCNCEKNLIDDGGFKTVTVVPGGSDITTSSPIWKKLTRTPQHAKAMGACDSGFVSMWGNKTVGESISQTGISLQKGKCYTVKFNARFVDQTGKLNPYVQLAVQGYSGSVNPFPLTPAATVSAPITNTAWASYSITFTATNNFNSITLFPVNGNAQNDGAYVSWIQLDNICVQECCTIPDEKCNAAFTTTPFVVNNQGNLIIHANPTVTTGAEHYWGLLGATGITDNTPIPLSTIMAGGSFGLKVSSTGVAAPIGMGTGINASTSGYGYSYQGVALGKCFKITHYIKCCNKWYSKTYTYCTKICTEVKESAPAEISTKEAEALEAVKGRG